MEADDDRRDATRLLVVVGVAYLLLALAALREQLVLYADGAYFAFTATLDRPWAVAWSEFPSRAGVFVTTVLPAHLLHATGLLGALGTSRAYQATWLLLPPVGVGATAAFLPRDRRALVVVAVVAWLALVMPTFGFPTEATVTLAVAFPLLAGALHPRPGAGPAAAWLALAALLAFSHEGMVLVAPVLGLALALGAPPSLRRRQAALGAALAVLVVAALAVSLLVPPHNPLQAAAMAQNRGHLGDLRILLVHPVLTAGVVSLGALALAALGPRGPVTVAAVGLALVLDALLAVRSTSPALFAPANHYVARTGIVGLLPLALLLGIAVDRTGRTPPRAATWALVVGLLGVHAVYEAHVLASWARFRDELVAELRAPATPAVDVAATGLGRRAKGDASLRRWLWPWVLPFQSVLVEAPGLGERRGILLDPTQWYVPIPCDRAAEVVAGRPPSVDAAAMDAWKADACAK